ncbi:hypothetical protein HED60_03070 [Planctomycetales bacterium ZRK34]|nr:hypothetical protein HED60_03070 [Planctomycetales bacterium ZRK34]
MAQGRVHQIGRGFAMTLIAAALVLGTAGFTSAAEEMMEAPAGPNLGKISLSGGVDFTNEYFFRGIYQGTGNDEGVIIQPYLDVSAELTDWLSVYVGTWNSLQTDSDDNNTGSDETWYEADWYFGASIALPANFSFDVSYIILYGPSSAGIFAEEIDLSLAYDDSALWGDNFDGLQPYVTVAFETDGASDGIEGEGVYYEVGIEPSFTVLESETMPVTLSIPMTAGFGSDYYEWANPVTGNVEEDEFGYFDIGLVASVPLSFIPSEYGAWSASVGVHGLFLGDTAEKIDETGDDFHVIGTFGIGFEY